jgi:hypothetical protein
MDGASLVVVNSPEIGPSSKNQGCAARWGGRWSDNQGCAAGLARTPLRAA